MGTWGEILAELRRQVEARGRPDFDSIRRGALASLAEYTGRSTILYAAGHLQKPEVRNVIISDEDMEGFMEVIYQLPPEGGLDLILHSPGGVAEAAESIVHYLRSKFTDIRVLVPQMAMSAATMIACAADRIVMARHSKLGPIDPQLAVQTELGWQLVPAWAILDQFREAKQEASDEVSLAVWYPILKQYGPALLIQSKNAINYSTQVVAEWLARFMFSSVENGEELAARAANTLADHRTHLTHGRPLHRDYLRGLGLVIEDLEDDQGLQDRTLTAYHAFMHTLAATSAFKLIENHLGRSFIRLTRTATVPSPSDEQKQTPGETVPA